MMTQMLVPICGSLIVVGILWFVIGRLVKKRAWLRWSLRLVVLVGILALTFTMMPPPQLPVSANTVNLQGQQPTDRTTVQTGSLNITLNAAGALSPAQQLELTFASSALVAEVFVTEGQRVEAGDVLARLDSTSAEATVRDAEIALAQAEANYNNLIQPPRDVDIAVAQAQVNVAEASLYSASLTGPDSNDEEIARLNAEIARNQLWQSQLNRDMQLAPNPEFRDGNGGAMAGEIQANSQVASQEFNVEIQSESYNATLNEGPNASSLSSANASLVQAQASLENLTNPASAAELRRSEIDLETARLDLQKAQEQLDKTQLIAPISGLVADEDLTVGEVPPSGGVITLIDDGSYTIDLAIDETDIVNVQVGQTASLSVDALPDADITGVVTKVADASTIQGQLITYTVTVTLDSTSAPLRPVMSATARLNISDLDDVILVPNRFIRVDGENQRTFVVIEEDGQYREAAVQIGARNSEESQILSGLEAGQIIVLLPTQTESSGGGFGGPPRSGAGGN